jgi:hypothetical protein
MGVERDPPPQSHSKPAIDDRYAGQTRVVDNAPGVWCSTHRLRRKHGQRCRHDLTNRPPGKLQSTPVAAPLSDEQRETFVAYVVEQLGSYVDDAGLAAPVENHYLNAIKP